MRRAPLLAFVPIAILACVLAVPVPAAAQLPGPDSRPSQPGGSQPYRGLFGGSSVDAQRRQSLDLWASASAGYDDNVFASGGEGTSGGGWLDPRVQQGGFYSLVAGDLTYTRRWRRTSLQLSTAHGVHYVPAPERLTARFHDAGFSLTVPVGRRASLATAGTVGYSPYYAFGMFYALDAAPEGRSASPYFGVSAVDNVQGWGSVSFNAQLTERTSLLLEYSRQVVRFTTERRNLDSQSVGGRLSRRITRNASLRLGYFRRSGDYYSWGGTGVIQHDIDVGLDYNRALSVTRRTRFGFGLGSSVYSMGPTAFARERTYYQLLGNARLEREMGRSWLARAEYRRDVRIIAGFPAPVLFDQVGVSLAGFAGRRNYVMVDASYNNGYPGFLGQDLRFKTYSGRANYQYALTRSIALSARYLYYHYDFGSNFAMPFELPSRLDRHAIVFGADFWVPFLK